MEVGDLRPSSKPAFSACSGLVINKSGADPVSSFKKPGGLERIVGSISPLLAGFSWL